MLSGFTIDQKHVTMGAISWDFVEREMPCICGAVASERNRQPICKGTNQLDRSRRRGARVGRPPPENLGERRRLAEGGSGLVDCCNGRLGCCRIGMPWIIFHGVGVNIVEHLWNVDPAGISLQAVFIRRNAPELFRHLPSWNKPATHVSNERKRTNGKYQRIGRLLSCGNASCGCEHVQPRRLEYCPRCQTKQTNGSSGTRPGRAIGDQLMFSAALLGFGLNSKVGAGENSGRTLEHDFVVLTFTTAVPKHSGQFHEATLSLPANISLKPKRLGVAFWVTRGGDLQPIQVIGGWLGQ